MNFWQVVWFRNLDKSEIKQIMDRLQADRFVVGAVVVVVVVVVVVAAADKQDR
jgi:hypothetical protein